VQFYFPGAVVNMQLTIDLIGDAAQNDEPVRNSDELTEIEEAPMAEKPKLLTLDLSSFL
jgi:hypothetical protein